MINLEPIAKKVQKRLHEKMRALGRETSYPGDSTDGLTQQEMLSRTTFIKMVSDQKKPVILSGGELDEFGEVSRGIDGIYGKRGELENPTKRPIAGIKSIDVSFKGGMRAHREATVYWTCWSFEDINRLTPHFLDIGKTVFLEWGWVYNKESFRNLPTFIDSNGIKRTAFKNYIDEVLDASGDYDMLTGTIKNFEFTTRSDGGFDCQTILSSVGVSIIDAPTPAAEVDDKTAGIDTKGEKDPKKLKKLYEEAQSKTETLLIKPTLTLKVLLGTPENHARSPFDEFILKQLKAKKPENILDYTWTLKHEKEEKVEIEEIKRIRWDEDKYITITTPKSKGKEFTDEVWVRWGWFEDNILSKFLSLCSDEDFITEFRSIEPSDVPTGPNGEKIHRQKTPDLKTGKRRYFYYVKNETGKKGTRFADDIMRNAHYESSRIRNSKFLETIEPKRYILPGQFHPQENDEGKTFPDITLAGDEKLLLKFAKVVNEKFSRFRTEPEMRTGYLRNMLINTKILDKAFGTGAVAEAVSISEGIEQLFTEINQTIPNYWRFTLEQDQVETHRVKIIDSSHTKIDFDQPLPPQRTDFDENRYGIFFFPVWGHNSIVKNQNITSKVADGLALMAMYGASIEKYKYPNGVSGVGDKAGLLVGALSNKDGDKRNENLDFAIKHEKYLKIGNKSGHANDPIKLNGSTEDLKTFMTDKYFEETLRKEVDAKENDTKKTPRIDTYQLLGVTKDEPLPPLTFLSDTQIKRLFESAVDAAKTAEDKEKIAAEINNIESFYGSKYTGEQDDLLGPGFLKEGGGKMKEKFAESVKTLIVDFDEKTKESNEPLILPLELELEIDGTGGIYPGNSYHSTYLSQNYKDKTVFQMFDVNHVVNSTGWSTTIRGKMRTTYNQVLELIKVDKEDILDKSIRKYSSSIVAGIIEDAHTRSARKEAIGIAAQSLLDDAKKIGAWVGKWFAPKKDTPQSPIGTGEI